MIHKLRDVFIIFFILLENRFFFLFSKLIRDWVVHIYELNSIVRTHIISIESMVKEQNYTLYASPIW
jgi:hypothetical protein